MSSAIPSAAFEGWRAAASLDGQLLRALLRAQRGTVLQDWIDCAELALAAGHPDITRMLYGYVFLIVGFSTRGLAWQAEVKNRTELWSDTAVRSSAPTSEPSTASFSVDIAIAELGRLMRSGARPALRAPQRDPPPFITATPIGRLNPQTEDRLTAACERVAAGLHAVPDLEAQGRLAEMLRDLTDELVALPPAPLENYLDRDVVQLATLLALDGLKRFVLEVYDLLHAVPRHSPLFEDAGRFQPEALGPYFSNLRLVIRNARDIFALIQAASPSECDEEDVETWCVLISARLPDNEVMELVDELADRGLTRALAALLKRTKRLRSVKPQKAVVCHIRDAALDLGEGGLAIEAQQFVISAESESALEWMLLGEMHGASDDLAAAETAIVQALRLHPQDAGSLERLTALRSGSFDQFAVHGGYSTPPWRHSLRRARMAARRADLPGSPLRL